MSEGKELYKLESKEGISLAGMFEIADYLKNGEIARAFIRMFKDNPGLTEEEYLKKAKEIYYDLGGHLIPEDEEE